MLVKEDFAKWIKASHDLFEIFENRHVAYSLAKNGLMSGLRMENLMLKNLIGRKFTTLIRIIIGSILIENWQVKCKAKNVDLLCPYEPREDLRLTCI